MTTPFVFAGSWARLGESDGRRLFLDVDSASVAFDTEGDTGYVYTYRRRGALLELEDVNGAVTSARIVKATPDSLVLDGVPLPWVSRPLRFWRLAP